MVELLHIHFSFLCRGWRSNKKGQSPIVLRIIFREERRDLYTGLYCDSDQWDAETGKVSQLSKQAATINKNLELINYQAMRVFDELKFSDNPFTIDELVARLKGKEERPTLLIEYLKNRNKELSQKVGLDITHTTYEKYERSHRYMIDFLEKEFKQKNYSLVRIDGKFLEKYSLPRRVSALTHATSHGNTMAGLVAVEFPLHVLRNFIHTEKITVIPHRIFCCFAIRIE